MIDKIKAWLKYNGVDVGVLVGVFKFSLIIILFVVGAFIIGISFSTKAHSADKLTDFPWLFKEYPYVYFGLELERGDTMCIRNTRGWDDKNWVSDGGFGQTVARWADWRLDFLYRHKSCAFLPDRNSYDSLGFQFTYQFGSRR